MKRVGRGCENPADRGRFQQAQRWEKTMRPYPIYLLTFYISTLLVGSHYSVPCALCSALHVQQRGICYAAGEIFGFQSSSTVPTIPPIFSLREVKGRLSVSSFFVCLYTSRLIIIWGILCIRIGVVLFVYNRDSRTLQVKYFFFTFSAAFVGW